MSSLLSHLNVNGKPSSWKEASCQDSQGSLQDGLLSVSPNPPVSLLENKDNGKEPTSHCCMGWEASSQSGAWLMMIIQRWLLAFANCPFSVFPWPPSSFSTRRYEEKNMGVRPGLTAIDLITIVVYSQTLDHVNNNPVCIHIPLAFKSMDIKYASGTDDSASPCAWQSWL